MRRAVHGLWVNVYVIYILPLMILYRHHAVLTCNACELICVLIYLLDWYLRVVPKWMTRTSFMHEASARWGPLLWCCLWAWLPKVEHNYVIQHEKNSLLCIYFIKFFVISYNVSVGIHNCVAKISTNLMKVTLQILYSKGDIMYTVTQL